MSKHKSTEIDSLEVVQTNRRLLSRISLSNEFTESLQQSAKAIIRTVYQKYGLELKDELTPTFFFWPNQRARLTQIMGRRIRSSIGEFSPDFGVNIIFLENDLDDGLDKKIAVICGYFHEMMHSMGDCTIVETDATTIRTGYHLRKAHIDSGEVIERGEFLEESVVDFLAVEMTQEYLRQGGIELDAETITRIAGQDLYVFVRTALLTIAGDHPDLLQLIIQARFNRKLLNQMVGRLREIYGPGTARRLFKAPFPSANLSTEVLRLAKPHLFR